MVAAPEVLNTNEVSIPGVRQAKGAAGFNNPAGLILGTKMELKGHQKIHQKNGVQKNAPGEPQGAPRGAQEAKLEPKGSQKAPKRAPKIDAYRVRVGN